MKKPIFLLFLVWGAITLTESCSTVPLTGRKQLTAIPSSQMLALSEQSYATVLEENKLSGDDYYVTMVKEVGERLSRAVESYLKQNSLESAVEGYDWQYNVIVSDALNAWCMPGGQIAFYEGILPVCEDENGEADELGLYFMAMAGYDPRVAPEFLSTHPDPTNRIASLNRLMPKALEYYNAR
jgi:predicted Zn-dependent protease